MDKRKKKRHGGSGRKEGVTPALHFINFTAISDDIVESKAREGDMLTGDPIRLKRGNTERWRKSKIAG